MPARVPSRRLHALFETVMKGERKTGGQGVVNLVFTDDRFIARLNRQFRDKDAATDVLSFNIDTPNSADSVFG
ncbi:MAG: hypothetical protein D6800_01360, partial [Candidatus Zixiibacteriota bacterium]